MHDGYCNTFHPLIEMQQKERFSLAHVLYLHANRARHGYGRSSQQAIFPLLLIPREEVRYDTLIVGRTGIADGHYFAVKRSI